jgi:hypothetical protein
MIKSNSLEKLIDNCINYSDYNISLVIYTLLKNKYRLSEDNKLEYYVNNNWIIDNNCNNLKKDIETIVNNEFLKRIKYWNNTENNDAELKVQKLLGCSMKLKNKKYILTIIKEVKSLFENGDCSFFN